MRPVIPESTDVDETVVNHHAGGVIVAAEAEDALAVAVEAVDQRALGRDALDSEVFDVVSHAAQARGSSDNEKAGALRGEVGRFIVSAEVDGQESVLTELRVQRALAGQPDDKKIGLAADSGAA